MWCISNVLVNSRIGDRKFNVYSNYSIIYDSKNDTINSNWFISGYILAKDGSVEHEQTKIDVLLEDKYIRFGQDFIYHIKGNFIIIKLSESGFTIYSDRFAIKKFFYWQSGPDFIISSDLNEITRHVNAQPSSENMAIYALTYHFTGGRTIFDNIYHNQPGQIIEFKNGKLSTRYYWSPLNLLEIPKRDISIEEISDTLSQAVSSSLKHAQQGKVSLSLTGGADTRNLLSIFLKLNQRPHLYTYGNPLSADCQKATAISQGLDLDHMVYNIKMDSHLFESYARKIIQFGGGLASIHRVHRLLAVEGEQEFADFMFLGTLGGEYIKGVSEDDYIVPSIVYRNWENICLERENLLPFLEEKYIYSESIDTKQLLSFLIQEPYMNGTAIERKHNALSFITAHLHDAQDVNLYATVMKDVYTPFLDIDYLELVFASKYTFDQKAVIGNKILERINNPVYGSEFLRATYKPLLKFLYSGDHKPSEVLFNKYYAAIVKAIRQKSRSKYPSNFPLGSWMQKFVENNLASCNDYSVIKNTFKLDNLLRDFQKGRHKENEAYWLKYTNPIMMRFLIEEYAK